MNNKNRLRDKDAMRKEKRGDLGPSRGVVEISGREKG